MIDLDWLDEGLTRAMTDEVRALRGMTPTWSARAHGTAEPAPVPAWHEAPEVGEPESWDDDALWAEAGFEPPEPDDPYERLDPKPEPAPAPAPEPVATKPAAPAPPNRAKLRPIVVQVPLIDQAAPAARPAPKATPKPAAAATPKPAAAATPAGEERVGALMAQGLVADADAEIARAGTPMEWRIMRALFDGRRNEAAASLRLVTKLGRGDRFWFQRYWVTMEWGDKTEQFEALDHCREQAYRHGETQWWGALTLQLARLGRHDEAARELAATMGGLPSWPDDANRLDIVTNLIEAAYLLGDAKAAETLGDRLRTSRSRTPLVVVGPGWVCKGVTERFEALAAAAAGHWKAADERFSKAAEVHEDLGAQPLLARTLVEWGHTVLPHDHSRGSRYIDCGITIADQLHLTGMAHLSRSPALAS